MQDLRHQLQLLIKQRDAIEQDIAERSAFLNGPGMPGIQGPLIDTDGFPKPDLDIAAIRAHRHQVICLSNDHKKLSQQIERLLQQLHQASRDNGSTTASSQPALQSQLQPMVDATPEVPKSTGIDDVTAVYASRTPFAVVNEVATGSPASEAGLTAGDQVLKCDDVTAGEGGELQRMAATLQAKEGDSVTLLVLRAGVVEQLTLHPHRWSGPGLLGCHLLPL